MAKKTPSDDEIRKRFGVQVDGLDKAQAKKMAAFQVDMVHFGKDVREYLEPGPAADSVWDAMDTLQKRIAAAIKDPQASTKPGPKAGTKPAAKPKKSAGNSPMTASSEPATTEEPKNEETGDSTTEGGEAAAEDANQAA